MPNQIFHDLDPRWQASARHATNICLHYGPSIKPTATHLAARDAMREWARMGYIEWNDSFPLMNATLFPANGGGGVLALRGPQAVPQRGSKPFVVCPDFKYSFISRDIAIHFGLITPDRMSVVGQGYRPPILSVFGWQLPQEYALYPVAETEVHLKLACCSAIDPQPTGPAFRFVFRVIGSPYDVAIIGRNVLDEMLFLYRGKADQPDRLPDAPSEGGRVYFGRDDRRHVI